MSVTVTFVGSGNAFGAGSRFQTCILVDAPGRHRPVHTPVAKVAVCSSYSRIPRVGLP
jgi:hypothetical protein